MAAKKKKSKRSEAKAAPREGVASVPDSRAWGLLERYRRLSDDAAPSGAGSSGDYAPHLAILLEAVVADFADWCAIELIDGERRHRVALRAAACPRSADDDDHASCCSPALGARVKDLEDLVASVARGGVTQFSGGPATKGAARCIAGALKVNDSLFGVVVFALEKDKEGYGARDLSAAQQVLERTGAAIERILLAHDAREAVRRTQRIASQLHQLIAASITVTSQRGEPDILKILAASTRNVFDADVAMVTLETGALAPLRGVASGAAAAKCESAGPDEGQPRVRDKTSETWTEDGWLVAPILERRDRAMGVVAIKRETGADFGTEDREVLTLLAQMAASALGAVDLSRTIETSEARLRVLIETAPAGIVEVAPDGHVRWWNRAAAAVFAWNDFVEGDEHSPEFPASAVAGLRAMWSEVLSGDQLAGRDFVDIEIAGRARVLTASAAVLAAPDGEVNGILTVVDDVTDHRELQAELRHAHTMEIRGQIASRIAHDFNNLLTLISGYAEILASELRGEDRHAAMVKDIQATASRASLLTSQLQTIGRTKVTEPVVFNPVSVIQSNAEVLERVLGTKIDLRWSLDEHAGNVRVDPDQFEQMILNLAINARDAMASGGSLTIALCRVTFDAASAAARGVAEGDFIELSVADTGVGMDEETRARCFEPLFTTKGPFKGTGLGLAAARRLVEENGGAIRCTSTLGEGTTFEVLLPLADGPAESTSTPVEPSRPRGSATVLLAEDDERLRRMMVQVLERNGYLVLETNSGEQAWSLARDFDGSIDLLVSDVVMGDITGPQLALSLQRKSPALRVLLVSGTADVTVTGDLEPGSAQFLAKPFKPSQLIDKVHELLARRD